MFKERLKKTRELNELSQKNLAKLLNVSISAISNWERGTATPSTQSIIKLCEILKVSANYLLGIDDNFMLNVKGLSDKMIVVFLKIIKDEEKRN